MPTTLGAREPAEAVSRVPKPAFIKWFADTGIEDLPLVSQLVAEQRWIKEIDINLLLASEKQIIALDARVILDGSDVREDALPPLASARFVRRTSP